MSKLIDLTSLRYGRWTVVSRAENSPSGQTRWVCKCNCGNTAVVQAAALRDSHSKSCGCLKIEQTAFRSTKHHHANAGKLSPTYHSWAGMKSRCLNPKHSSFSRYGGRGIKICKRWLEFENFLADMGERPKGLSIERKNTNGNYEPRNCEWSTATKQARNKRNNCLIKVGKTTRTLAEWAEVSGVSPSTICDRLSKGWSPGRAISIPASSKGGYGSNKLRQG